MTATSPLRILAWLLLIGLIVVTVGPIGWRPVSPLPTQIERALALMIVGFVFALAYPRHIVLITVLVLGTTAILEPLQIFEPSRHGRLVDALVKLLGGCIGLGAGYLFDRYRPRG